MKSLLLRILIIGNFFMLSFYQSEAQPNYRPTSQNAVTARWIRENIVHNPVDKIWLKQHLSKGDSRLLFTKDEEQLLRKKMKTDPILIAYYDYLKSYANTIFSEPLPERKLMGRRLLGTSREEVLRISVLSFLYRMEREQKYLERVNKEIETVCDFSDWNPIHFLDVAEMSMAVAIGIDWVGKWLPSNTVSKAKEMLKKHLEISLADIGKFNWWVDASDNWNQVCHSGLSASALVLADNYSDLSAKIINRAIDKLPIELASYSPDGAYPEGTSYWGYGTAYNLAAISFFESALGTDFNMPKSPGFMESAIYRLVMVGPSGNAFDYSDAGLMGLGLDNRGSLAWFAQKTGNDLFLNQNEFISQIKEAKENNMKPPRFAPLNLIWIAHFNKTKSDKLPIYWKGEGHNPIAVFRSENNTSNFYLGVKGGTTATVPINPHGNMDVGSFIFELNGVRWSIDPGTQDYLEIEQNKTIGQRLWDESQNSPRWTLLTKNNKFHSTLTINGANHNVYGFAPIVNWNVNEHPQTVSLDLSYIFRENLDGAFRTFKKLDEQTVQIEDSLLISDLTNSIMWSMMTQADVTIIKGGAVLNQEGKQLKLKILYPENLSISVTSLNPPPLPYDKKIEGLKRIELNIPKYLITHPTQKIVVQLTGE